jgi:broad specificity phosphatase PhoE
MLRHGQAAHNVRAEAARKAGCDFDTFLHLMALDDAYDAPLTTLGTIEAKDAAKRADNYLAQPQIVLVSPLSRALHTATIAFPRHTLARAAFVCDERLRERNGKLLNAKRRPKSELERAFPTCDFSALADESDTQWTPELESLEACAARGREVLDHVWERAESEIAIVGQCAPAAVAPCAPLARVNAHGRPPPFARAQRRPLLRAPQRRQYHQRRLRRGPLLQLRASTPPIAALRRRRLYCGAAAARMMTSRCQLDSGKLRAYSVGAR